MPGLERITFERAPVSGIMVIDVANRMVTLSRELAPLYGCQVSLAGRPISVDRIYDALMPEDRGPLHEIVQRTIASGEVMRVRYSVRDIHGQWRWVSAEGQCFYDDTGKAISYPVAIRDVTETVESGCDLNNLGNHLLEALRICNDYRMDETSECLKDALHRWGKLTERSRH